MYSEISNERAVTWLNEMLLQARQNAWSAILQAIQVAVVLGIAAILDHPRTLQILEHLASGSFNPELLWVARWSFILAAALYLAVLAFFFVNSLLHIRAVRILLDKVSR